MVEKYTVKEYAANPSVLGTNADIITAAFRVNGITEATLDDAKKIVKDFKGRKVRK